MLRRITNKENGCWPHLLHLVLRGKAAGAWRVLWALVDRWSLAVHEEADPAELAVYDDAGGKVGSAAHGSYKVLMMVMEVVMMMRMMKSGDGGDDCLPPKSCGRATR